MLNATQMNWNAYSNGGLLSTMSNLGAAGESASNAAQEREGGVTEQKWKHRNALVCGSCGIRQQMCACAWGTHTTPTSCKPMGGR